MIPMIIPMVTLMTTLTSTQQNTMILIFRTEVPTALKILYIYCYSLHLFRVQSISNITDRVFITAARTLMKPFKYVQRIQKNEDTNNISLRQVCYGERERRVEARSLILVFLSLFPFTNNFQYDIYFVTSPEPSNLYMYYACCQLMNALLNSISYPGVAFMMWVILALSYFLAPLVLFLTTNL